MREKAKRKSNKKSKYMTINVGYNFRTIAKILTEHGYTMNHATARNQAMHALNKLVVNTKNNILQEKVILKDNFNINSILRDNTFNENLVDMLHMAWDSIKSDKITKPIINSKESRIK